MVDVRIQAKKMMPMFEALWLSNALLRLDMAFCLYLHANTRYTSDRCTMVHFIVHFIAIPVFDMLCIFVLLVSTGALQLSFDLVMVFGEVVLNIF